MKAGLIKEGYPADLVLVDPSEEWQIRPKAFVSKSLLTPFGDWILGRVHKTIKSGQVVYDADAEEPFNPIKAEKSERNRTGDTSMIMNRLHEAACDSPVCTSVSTRESNTCRNISPRMRN